MRYKTLYKNMWSFAHKLLGENTPRQVTYWASRMLDNPKVKVRVLRVEDCYSGLTVGGHFEPEEVDKDITIYIHFTKTCDKVYFDHKDLQVFIQELFTTYVHEKRHRYQYRTRGDVYGPIYRCSKLAKDKDHYRELNYYGDPDEVDAYALESAIEYKLRDTEFVVMKYRDLFANTDIKVYNKFLKKRYKFLNKISL